MAVSHDRGDIGALVDLGLESRHRRVTLSARMQRSFGDYQDLASLTAQVSTRTAVGTAGGIGAADPLYAAAFKPPRALDQAVVSMPLWNDRTRLSLSYARIVRQDDKVRLLGLSLSRDFHAANLYVRALHDFDHSGASSISIGLSLPLGRGVYGSTEVASTAKGASVVAEAASRTTDAPGQLGWRVRFGEGVVSDRLVSASYVTTLGRAEAGLQQINGRVAGYGQFSGGAAYVLGQPFLSRRLDGPFAVVEAGVKGLPVRFENRLVGTTGAGGRFLVPNLVAYQPNRISIDPTNLPLDQDVATDTTLVSPRNGAAAVVRLGWTSSASALVSIIDQAGQPMPAGSAVHVEGAPGDGGFVGYDGEAWISGLSPRNTATVTTPEGVACRVSFDYRPRRGEQVRIGPLTCRPAAAPTLRVASTPPEMVTSR